MPKEGEKGQIHYDAEQADLRPEEVGLLDFRRADLYRE